MNIHTFTQRKLQKQKISMITCYDFWSASIIARSNLDCILVGDSGAMIMHGHSSTVPADIHSIATQVRAVVKGAPKKFVIGDMPFCSYRKSLSDTIENAQLLMQAGAQAIKLEGAIGNYETITHLVESGIPVMGHLGLTPQAIHTLGGFKVQGIEVDQAKIILQQAQQLADSGCFAIVLECIPASLAKKITDNTSVATIGIGAGPHTDGQVLVLQDMLGFNPSFKAKFVKQYLNGYELMLNALNDYHHEVAELSFPDIKEHCYAEVE